MEISKQTSDLLLSLEKKKALYQNSAFYAVFLGIGLFMVHQEQGRVII